MAIVHHSVPLSVRTSLTYSFLHLRHFISLLFRGSPLPTLKFGEPQPSPSFASLVESSWRCSPESIRLVSHSIKTDASLSLLHTLRTTTKHFSSFTPYSQSSTSVALHRTSADLPPFHRTMSAFTPFIRQRLMAAAPRGARFASSVSPRAFHPPHMSVGEVSLSPSPSSRPPLIL